MRDMFLMLLAMLITCIVGYFIETLRIKYTAYRMKLINKYLVVNMKMLIKNDKEVNIFLINNIRNFLKEKFLKRNKIDKYEIYKLDRNNIYIRLYKDKVLDDLNLYIDDDIYNLSELSITPEEDVSDN